MRCSHLTALALVGLALPLAGCSGDDTSGNAETLVPEPAGAPADTQIADTVDTRLTCLGNNAPAPVEPGTLTLPGWARAFADPSNAMGTQPAAQAEAFGVTGASLATAFSDTGNGRTAISVPVRAEGFTGWTRVTADGLVPTTLFSSRPYTTNAVAGWVFLPTGAERDAQAMTAGVTLDPTKGVLVGSVHDCDVFGVSNAVVRYDEQTDGVIYLEGFAPVVSRTFTDVSGRFAVPNLDPGSVTVDAFGRLVEGGPLVLLSRTEVTITAGEITSVDLQPRVAAAR